MSMKGYITQVLKILLWLWYLPSPPIQKSLGKAFWLNCVYLEERGSIPGNQSIMCSDIDQSGVDWPIIGSYQKCVCCNSGANEID